MLNRDAARPALAVIALSLTGGAHAEVLRWQIAGAYQMVDGAPPGLLAPLGVGDTFNIDLRFDTDTIQSAGADRGSASYSALLSPSSAFVFRNRLSGGADLSTVGIGAPAVFFDVFDNEPGDGITAMLSPVAVPSDGRGKAPVVSLSFGVTGSDSLWDGVAPQTGIQYPDFLSGTLTMTYPGGSATATIVSWHTTVIPMPGSLTVMGAGLLLARRRRR